VERRRPADGAAHRRGGAAPRRAARRGTAARRRKLHEPRRLPAAGVQDLRRRRGTADRGGRAGGGGRGAGARRGRRAAGERARLLRASTVLYQARPACPPDPCPGRRADLGDDASQIWDHRGGGSWAGSGRICHRRGTAIVRSSSGRRRCPLQSDRRTRSAAGYRPRRPPGTTPQRQCASRSPDASRSLPSPPCCRSGSRAGVAALPDTLFARQPLPLPLRWGEEYVSRSRSPARPSSGSSRI
jgi:hypothetical protein